MRCVQFTGEGDFSQKPNDTCKMTLSGSRTVNLDRHSSLSVVWVVSKSLQSLTAYTIWYILCAILGNLTHQCHSSYDNHHWKGEWLYMA